MQKLIDFRERIDSTDEKIITLIYERLEICKEVAQYKSANNIAMMQPDRVNQVLLKRREFANSLLMNPDLIENIYKLVISEACSLEDEIIFSLKKDN